MFTRNKIGCAVQRTLHSIQSSFQRLICSTLVLLALSMVYATSYAMTYPAEYRWFSNISYRLYENPERSFNTAMQGCEYQANYFPEYVYTDLELGPYTWLNPERTFGHNCFGWRNGTKYNIGRVWQRYTCPTGDDIVMYPSEPTVGWVPQCRSLGCPIGLSPDETSGKCLLRPVSENTGQSCPKVSDPIHVSTGNSVQFENDYQDVKGLSYTRTYNSALAQISSSRAWSTPYSAKLLLSFEGQASAALIVRPDGRVRIFDYQSVSGSWESQAPRKDKLEDMLDASGTRTGFKYTDYSGNVETYSSSGVLQSIISRGGYERDLTYSDGTSGPNGGYFVDSNWNNTTYVLPAGILLKVTDSYSRTLQFKYNQNYQMAQLTPPDGALFRYQYDGVGNIAAVIYPDDTPGNFSDNARREYRYEDARFPNTLTKIVDRLGDAGAEHVKAYWTFDTEGRAISSSLAGGIDTTLFSYNTDGSTTVTNPLGKQSVFHFVQLNGVLLPTQIEGVASASCGATSRLNTYSSEGFLESSSDWNGNITTYARDAFGKETSRVEAIGKTEQRTIGSEWDNSLQLPTRITEPNKVTEFTYQSNGLVTSKQAVSIP